MILLDIATGISRALFVVIALILAGTLSFEVMKHYAKDSRERQSSDDNDGEDRR